jgi:hypothetical protein
MSAMFYSASAFNHDISSWTGSAATTAQTNMFLDASAFQAKFACTDAITGPANSCFERLVNLETCSVLYEAISPVLPFLKAATVDFPADHSTFGSNYAYYVYAEITTGSTFNSYEDVYLLGGTSALRFLVWWSVSRKAIYWDAMQLGIKYSSRCRSNHGNRCFAGESDVQDSVDVQCGGGISSCTN